MKTSRTARRGLVTAVAVLACGVALLAPAWQGDDADEPFEGAATQGGKRSWPDLATACAGGLVPDDRRSVEQAGARFFARGPELMAAETGVGAAVAVFRARDDRAVALCRGTALPGGHLSFVTTVHPFRRATTAQSASPLVHQTTCTDAGRCTAALVIADRLNPQVAGLVARLEGGREVQLRPQQGSWIARIIEVEIARSTDEVLVERVLYTDPDGEHLAEWVPSTESRNAALPPLTRFPGVEKECVLGAGC